MLMLNYYMMYMSMEYYMKVYICVDDYYMNNLLMNCYMNAYVVRCCRCCTLLLMLYVVVD